ncbi:MAG: nitroreductase family protein [Verrucomicrobiota bacterium]|nr:nitroreductase family protein [Chthoniobacterales bacterium]MDQ3315247.1 nitroreductase family protein [Verrucomicrobiota bacterium]
MSQFVPAPRCAPPADEELLRRAKAFYDSANPRRTVREFSNRPVPREVIELCIRSAGTAPNGANLQPWHFVAISDANLKREIRAAAEAEEKEFYEKRAPKAWLEALAPLGTDSNKPFLTTAPWLIAVFAQPFRELPDGTRSPTYYAIESVGIATGLLVTAVHSCGLASLTHTPSPMGFLNRLLGRPSHEKPFLLLVVGHPAESAMIPDISRKPLDEISSFRMGQLSDS